MDSAAELVQLVFRFCAAVREAVDGTCDDGDADDKAFVHRSRACYRALKASVRASAPDFRPFEDPGAYVRPPEPRKQLQEDEFDHVGAGAAGAGGGDSTDADGGDEGVPVSVPVMGVLDVRRVIQE